MAKSKTDALVESEDEADIGALVVQAAEQLTFAGKAATATVRIAVDDQWFSCTLRMIDAPEVKS